MSAITGIFYRDGRKVDPKLIKKMNDRLSHRGPDGSAVWCDGSVAFGHQMLWTTPESLHEKLPFEESGLVITSDARIDNRKELSEELDIEDKEDVSDSYFILKSYEKWGEDCPKYLLGDFAFAIWDKNEEKLFCARDHMGVKPFYYYISNDKFFFATELKAIFFNQEIPRKINELKVADFLSSMFEDREITFYEDILRLPASNFIKICKNNFKIDKYWSLNLEKRLKLDSDEKYTKKFRDAFNESVKCRLRSAFPIGSMLSGGLDSSSIVCTASEILSKNGNQKLKTFSAVFDDMPECDESHYIKKVVEEKEIEPHYVHADKISPLVGIKKILWQREEPLYSPNIYIDWVLFNEAQNNGVRIILDGYDGDTTISHGEAYLLDLFRKMKFIRLLKEIKGISYRLNYNPITLFLYGCIFPIVPNKMKMFYRLLRGYGFQNGVYNELIREEFALQVNLKSRIQILEKFTEIKNQNPRKYHYNLLDSGEFQFVLEVLDGIAGIFSLEPRYPFFDKRLMELCLSLPTEQKMHNGWDRIIMRRAMEDILPKEVQWRLSKSNLGPNFDQGLIKFEKDIIEDVIYNNFHLINKYIDYNKLESAYKRYRKGQYKIGRPEDDVMTVWKALNLNLWLFEKHSYINKQGDDMMDEYRKNYLKPKLIKHGNVEKITAKKGPMKTDGHQGERSELG